jgi:hypothetical protein
LDYLGWRYFDHPVYDYTIWGIPGVGGGLFVVMREVIAEGSIAYRIVDFLGDRRLLLQAAPRIGAMLKAWLQQQNGEYIELTQAGLGDDLLGEMAFCKVNTGEEVLVMPAYFEPFEQRNVDIFYFSSIKQGQCLFLGDGDQDRPSQLRSAIGKRRSSKLHWGAV